MAFLEDDVRVCLISFSFAQSRLRVALGVRRIGPWLKYLHDAGRLHVQMLVAAPYQKLLLRAPDHISPDTAAALLSVEAVSAWSAKNVTWQDVEGT